MEEKVCYKTYTTCRIEKECQVKYEMRKHCYTVCEQKSLLHAVHDLPSRRSAITAVRRDGTATRFAKSTSAACRIPRAGWCRKPASDTSAASAATPCKQTCYKVCPYTTCHMIRSAHPLRVPQALLQRAGRARLLRALHDLPDGEEIASAREEMPDEWFPEENVCCVPYTTCRMVEEVNPVRAADDLLDGAVLPAHTRPAGWCPFASRYAATVPAGLSAHATGSRASGRSCHCCGKWCK